MKQISVSPTTLSNVQDGDEVIFQYIAHYNDAGSGAKGVSVEGFNSAYWTNSSDIIISNPGSTQYIKYVKSPPTSYGSETLSFVYDPYNKVVNKTFDVVNAIDTVPDQFSLGGDATNAYPNNVYAARSVTVSGINATTPISITNGTYAVGSNITANNFTSNSGTVENGDVVAIRGVAPSTYNTSKDITLNIGGVTDTWRITTMPTAPPTEIIPLGITSGTIKLKADISDFFGYSNINLIKLTDYYKGGSYVPNITENANIPSSGTIKLTDFYGAATALYFNQWPSSKQAAVNTGGVSGSMELTWQFPTDMNVAYGVNLYKSCEMRYEIIPDADSDPGIYVMTPTGYATYSSLNDHITLKYNYSSNEEAVLKGVVKVYVKHPKDTDGSKVVTAEFSYFMLAFYQ